MDLNVDYEQTRSTGTQVLSKGDEFNSLLTKIKGINSELQSYWEGQDASKYSGAVEVQAQNMDKLAATIKEIGDFLIKVGDAYERASQSNADAISY